MFDPRILSGPAMLVLGLALLHLAWRMWFVHPLNRVLILGPFVTEKGIEAALKLRMTILALGSFNAVWGLASVVYWWFDRDVNAELVQFLGALGTGLGIWASCMVLRSVLRLRGGR